MFFSISIPIYNAEKYLDNCIRSVLSQTEKDYELILVDDGSKDNSLEICRKWKDEYPEIIKIIEKNNEGSLLTRRRCIRESAGQYLYIIDADDEICDPDALKKIRGVIEEEAVDLVLFNCVTTTNRSVLYSKVPFDDHEVFDGKGMEKLWKYAIIRGAFNPLWNKVFSRNLVDSDIDYNDYSHVGNGTDWFQSIPIIFNSTRAIYLNEGFYCYTIDNEASIVHVFKPSMYQSLRSSVLRLAQCAEKKEIENVQGLLKQRFMGVAYSAVIQLRLKSILNRSEKVAYLKSIATDESFINNYTLENLYNKQKIIVWLLKKHLYNTLLLFIAAFKKKHN